MTTNRIITTLIQLVMLGVTVPLLILTIKDLKHDLKNKQLNFQLIPTRPTAAGLSEMSDLRHYVVSPEIHRNFTACRFDRQNGHLDVITITPLERLKVWNYWLVN